MSVNSYMDELAGKAIIRDSEKQSISLSISTLHKRLHDYFKNEYSKQFIFGSYTRGTILPRAMDDNSDIDYMIVFNNSTFKPQTYLDKLRRFVNICYSSSEITQSYPTIVLTLKHIKFELVPTINGIWSEFQIPAKQFDLNCWISTNPNDINQTLTNTNQNNNNLIKPMIRLVKYWNASNNYPFASFELEKKLAEKTYILGSLLSTKQLKDYFFDAIDSLSLNWGDAQYKKDALNRAKSIVKKAKNDLNNGWNYSAEAEIKKLLPEVVSSKSLLGGF